MIPAEIPINYARKKLTKAQFQRRCDRLLTQKLVHFTKEEREQIESIRRKKSISKGLLSLQTFLQDKLNSMNANINKYIFGTIKDKALKGEPWEKHLGILGFKAKKLEKAYEFFNALVYKPSTNPDIREIEKNLSKKGVKAKFSDKTSVDFAKLTQESIQDIERNGAKVPTRISISPLIGQGENGMVIIGPTKPAKTVFIGSEFASQTKGELKNCADIMYQYKFTSSPSSKRTIYHESAHLEHSGAGLKELFVKCLASIFFPDKAKPVLTKKDIAILRREVSGYAERDPKGLDAVAEIRSGILAGKTYSEKVMAIYDKLKGPMLKNS